MYQVPVNSLSNNIQLESSQKALRDLSPVKKRVSLPSQFPFYFSDSQGFSGDPLSNPQIKQKRQIHKIIGLKVTPSDLKALVEWKDPREQTSWISIKNFSRVDQFIQEAGDFSNYFKKIISHFKARFPSKATRFRKFCRRTFSPPSGLEDFPLTLSCLAPVPSLVSYFSRNYFTATSSCQLRKRISKNKRIFFYVRNPQSVESSTKSESSFTQDNSLNLSNHHLITSFLREKARNPSSSDEQDSQGSSEFNYHAHRQRITLSPGEVSKYTNFKTPQSHFTEALCDLSLIHI